MLKCGDSTFRWILPRLPSVIGIVFVALSLTFCASGHFRGSTWFADPNQHEGEHRGESEEANVVVEHVKGARHRFAHDRCSCVTRVDRLSSQSESFGSGSRTCDLLQRNPAWFCPLRC